MPTLMQKAKRCSWKMLKILLILKRMLLLKRTNRLKKYKRQPMVANYLIEKKVALNDYKKKLKVVKKH